MKQEFDCLIVGGGLTGLCAGLAFAQSGLRTAIIEATDTPEFSDARASALAATSLAMLRALGLGSALAPNLSPVEDMMIGEGRPGEISPISLHFSGHDRAAPMAQIIENAPLKSALWEAAMAQDDLILLTGHKVTGFHSGPARARLTVSGGNTLDAPLCIAADGRGSPLRRLAQITAPKREYDQAALTLTLAHSRPHNGTAHQLFLPGGPLALLPLTGNRTSLIWSDRRAAIKAAMALDEAAFVAEVSRRIGNVLGELSLASARQSYPLSLQITERYVSGRLALIGDSAHVIHPLAGQGLNMGLRDAAALHEIAFQARAAGLDIGGAELAEYERVRASDNQRLAGTTDALNQIFRASAPPARHARRLGMAALDRLPALQQFFISEAAGELGDLPALMRG
jgi:2-octaprenyl-6-methoxyphenol hydroxylase